MTVINKIIHLARNAIWSIIDSKHLRLTSDDMPKLMKAVNQKHLELLTEIGLDDCWSDQDNTDMEVKIALLRAKLRYSPEAFQMIEQVLENYKKSSFYNKKLKYFTLAFPMVHPGKEVSIVKRKDLIHNDQVGQKRLFTVWTPITQYRYPPLCVFPFYSLLRKIPPYSFFEKICASDVKVDLGESIMWGGGYTHAGNKNTSDTLSAALVIRLIEEPLMYEPVRRISDGVYSKTGSAQNDMTTQEQLAFCKDMLAYSMLGDHADETFEHALQRAKNFIQDRISKPNNELGFCLTVMAQRMKEKLDQNFFYAAALLISSEYLYGLYFFKNKFTSMTSQKLKDTLKKYDYLDVAPIHSYQVSKLLQEKPTKDAAPFMFHASNDAMNSAADLFSQTAAN